MPSRRCCRLIRRLDLIRAAGLVKTKIKAEEKSAEDDPTNEYQAA